MYLDVAIKAAKEAEKIVLSYFGKEKNIQKKGEIDLVTKADLESEKKIVQIIKEKFPEHGFILEEQDNKKTDSEYLWIIDPIDGTTSFAHNYPMFSISIALHKNKIPILGVVDIPYMKELFYAEVGKGAYLNGKKIKVSSINNLKESLISTGFPYDRLTSNNDNLNYFSKIAKKAGGLRRSGSAAIDICYVACGRCEGYWELGLKIMDTAAAQVILRESNGKVTDFKGDEIKEDYSKILASNGHIHKVMIDTLKEAE